MLELTPPTSVRPIPEDVISRGRTPGGIGWVLDGKVIAEYVHSTLPEHECSEACKVRPDELLLLQSKNGQHYGIIGNEGVGQQVRADAETIPAYVAVGFMYDLFEIPQSVVQQAITGEGADVAGFVRLFGGRLNSNAYIWREFVTR
jgi:hypothetical protein